MTFENGSIGGVSRVFDFIISVASFIESAFVNIIVMLRFYILRTLYKSCHATSEKPSSVG